ncbi:hypothetical protein [Pseudomonas sp. zjy_8]|uniref:hypothetical protein n=1 Tax=Pseudomonas sp. GLN_2 TaxID=3367180 RepID=UPI00370C3A50
MQSRYQHRREIAKMVMEAAAKDRSEQIELGMKLGQVGKIAPVALFVHYHAKLFELVGSGKLTQENLSKLHKENQEMSELMHRMHDQEMRRQ